MTTSQKLGAWLLCLVFSTLGLQAQKEESRYRNQTIEDYDNIGSAYYGVNTFLLFHDVVSETAINKKVKPFGPAGFVYERMVSNIFGVGLEAGFSKLIVDYDEADGVNYGTNYVALTHHTINLTTVQVMFRTNFHAIRTERFDLYGLVSVGYRSVKWKHKSSNPGSSGPRDLSSLIPMGVRAGIGFRYFFTENLGLNVEVGSGAPVLSGGVSWGF